MLQGRIMNLPALLFVKSARQATRFLCHCEERSDAAISWKTRVILHICLILQPSNIRCELGCAIASYGTGDCHGPALKRGLAMTYLVVGCVAKSCGGGNELLCGGVIGWGTKIRQM